jgi:hypothetical protein
MGSEFEQWKTDDDDRELEIMWLERAKPYSISQWICINNINNTWRRPLLLGPMYMEFTQTYVQIIHCFHIAVRFFLRIMIQNNPYFYA